MTPNELVDRIRRGDADAAITDFLASVPEATLEMLAVNAMGWQMPDVAETILQRLIAEEPDNLGAHLTLAKNLFSQRRFVDALPEYQYCLSHMPSDPIIHGGICWGLGVLRRYDDLRQAIGDAKRNIPTGRHLSWQAARQIREMPADTISVIAADTAQQRQDKSKQRQETCHPLKVATWAPRQGNTFDDFILQGWSVGTQGARGWFEIDGKHEIPASPSGDDATVWQAPFTGKPGARHRVRLCLETQDGATLTGQDVDLNMPATPFAQAVTQTASEAGPAGATLVGEVAAGAQQSAAFRFEYGDKPDALTQATPWQPVPGPRNARFVSSPHWTPLRSWYYGCETDWIGGPLPYLKTRGPYAQDPNHISGIGFMELLYACWHNSVQHDGYRTAREWECSDLRDAVVRLRLRAEGLQSHERLYCLGVGNVETYWMLSSQAVDIPADGAQELVFHLSADPSDWTCAGNNEAEQQDHGRYGYGPLDSALGRNQGNLVLIAPFGDPKDTISGELAFGEVSVDYRDNNILRPQTGTRLIEFPTVSPCDPMNLTNGIYGDPDAGWYSLGTPSAPPRFTWDLPQPLAITTVILHQDPIMPTATCRVTLSDETGQGDSWDVALPVLDAAYSATSHLVLSFEGSGTYSRVSIELLDAAGSQGRGLQSIEVFARDFHPPASEAPVMVSADINGLSPDGEIYYRASVRAGDMEALGEVKSFRLPESSDRPLVHHVRPHIETADKLVFQVRANAMGTPSWLEFEIDGGDTQDLPLGCDTTPVHRYITLAPPPSGAIKLTVTARNAHGAGTATTIAWEKRD